MTPDFSTTNYDAVGQMQDEYLQPGVSAAAGESSSATAGDLDLAIVGMAGRFPGAPDIGAFWRNLIDGVESVSRFSDEEIQAAGIDPALSAHEHYVKAGGVLEDAEWFDAHFFGIYPREAEIMDPQHRVFLEVAFHALEHAGYDPATYERAIGVYAGCGLNTYLIYNLAHNREIMESVQGYQLTVANDKDYLPTRVAYKLNLRGPAVNVQTACSTSLVATHLACQALLSHECDMALAGGVTIRLPQKGGYLYQEGGITSPDGHCRAFDARAAGTVGGNGVGAVVLKRLADALADGDTIHAIIKGTAINNDGSNKVGYTAPSVEGQTAVISTAQAVAGVDPGSLSYIEAHGTGTALGDPIEIAALSNAFGPIGRVTDGGSGQFCAIGSLKTNVGHLDAAAGVAGLIKTTLALEHRRIPPSLHYTAPNPRIDFASSPFYVNTELAEWRSNGAPRRAGVSSFGIGGTNAHVVLEEAPTLEPTSKSRAMQLLTLSAKTEEALEAATANLAAFLGDLPDESLADAAYTLKVGRQPFKYRRVAVVRDSKDAHMVLSGADAGARLRENGAEAGLAVQGARSVAFMFTGQGSQYPDMGLGLYISEPVFRAAVDRCADLLRPHLGADIRSLLYPRGAADADEKLRDTAFTQPALFVIEYALGQLWLSWGIRPDAMIGHSIGEYVAAHLAGVMSLDDALMVVAARGRLMGSLPGGSMLSLSMSEVDANALLAEHALLADHPELVVATINAPEMVVVAGPHAAVDRLEETLTTRGIATRRLHTSHAFHSAMMDPILAPFIEVVRRARLHPPTIPYVSNVTGTWISADEATDPEYYARHLRSAVRFADGLATLAQEPERAFLEVGPGRTLASLAKAHPAVARNRPVVTSLRHPSEQADDLEIALGALGQLWLSGIAPTWNAKEQREGAPWAAFYADERRRRIPLPLYPFQRERYWVEPDEKLGAGPAAAVPASVASGSRPAVKTGDINRWFYVPAWLRVAPPARADAAGRKLLVFVHGTRSDLEEQLLTELEARSGRLPSIVVPASDPGTSDATFAISPAAIGDYVAFLSKLKEADWLPDTVVHLWGAHDVSDFEKAQAYGFDSLIALARAWGAVAGSTPLQLDVVSRGLFDVIGEETIVADRATVLGVCRVMGQEYPGVRVRVLDLPCHDASLATPLVEQVLAPSGSHRTLALRGRHWWAQTVEQIETHASPTALREAGVYLITGGLGRIGLVLAAHIARTVHGRLVLVDRTGLPGRELWPQLLADGEPDENTTDSPAAALRSKLRQVLSIEAAGARVLIVQADITDAGQMRGAVRQALDRFGDLHGVIHAAGTVGQSAIRSIAETDAAVREAQFGPKIGGVRALAHALEGRRVDFVVLMSSMSTVLGGLGFAAYAAANSFLDAFAVEQARAGEPWLSVAWDGWAFPEEQALGAIAAAAQAFAITVAEGAAAFDHLLSLVERGPADRGPVSCVMVSTADLNTRLLGATGINTMSAPLASDHGAAGPTTQPTDVAAGKSAGKYARPKLRTAYAEPSNDIERAIVADWEKVLGIAPIGIHDDFFELGGHSLLATQLVSRLRDAYHVELPLRNLFETPTVAGLAALVRHALVESVSLSVEQAAQASGEGADRARMPSHHETIRPVSRDRALPLSFGQERMWFLDQLTPGSSLYNNFAALRLKAVGAASEPGGRAGTSFDPARLAWALNQVVARHEVLRTVFGERDGKPTQIILPHVELAVPLMDLRQGPEVTPDLVAAATLDERVNQLALAEARAPFDLSTGPLLRAKLLQTGEDEFVLFFTMHHIVSDGWSVGVLIRELVGFYEAARERNAAGTQAAAQAQPSGVADLKLQFADYAAWQREWLNSERRQEELTYWQARLSPEPEPLELPADRPRPTVQTSHGANHWFSLDKATYHNLDALAKGEGATLFMALLAGLQTLLYRYTGQTDICVGTPVANRDRRETEDLIGFLLNTLVLRTQLSPAGSASATAPSFRELLHRVREVALGAYAHQDLPFEMLVEALQPTRDMSRAPYFQVMFDLQAAPLAGLSLPSMVLSPLRIDAGTAKFDLALSLEYAPDALEGYLNYNTDLFDPETIAAMVEHFGILLADAVARPDAALTDLALMSPLEEHRLLVEWNASGLEAAGGLAREATAGPGSVVEMFEAQAALRPMQTALVMATGVDGADAVGSEPTLTYEALNKRANQIARHMAQQGIGKESDQVVALILHRNPDMVAALLAVLKAGAALLPIDPATPPERIAFILSDSGAAGLIADSAPPIADLPGCVVRLDEDNAIIAAQPTENLACLVDGSGLAYVIYTSGSTGQPKGVLIEHSGLALHILDVSARFGLQAEDHILQFAAYTFDQGLEQMLTALTVGGTLVVRGEEIWPPAEFPRVLQQYGLNVINLPPAYWNQVLQEWAASDAMAHRQKVQLPAGQLRTIISGGDVLTPESLRLWQAVSATEANVNAAQTRLINAYGPTETTITACAFDVPEDWFGQAPGQHVPDRAPRPAPIGRPLPKRLAFVVDRQGKPTPTGVPGELWLGGNGVARGYLNRPELTAERFTPNSTAYYSSSRVYRTGDLVRYRRDGNLEFLGRLDEQVKVRGFRIELGEIEAALLTHDSVKQAAVIAQGDGADKQLVAYVVAADGLYDSGKALPPASLRAYLNEKLPSYMVPAAFVTLPALPINASGKIDRGALRKAPLPKPDELAARAAYVAPATPIEQEIAAIWADVLKLPQVGVDDNFFDLGGHSLLATQIVSRLRTRYPVELPLRRLFEAPTVAALARLIEEGLLAQHSDAELAALLSELDGLTEEETRAIVEQAGNLRHDD